MGIGLSLGIFGSGGAILTFPVLVYLVGYEEKLAVLSTLIIVGILSLLSSIPNLLRGQLSYKHLVYFAVPSLVTSYLGGVAGTISPDWLQLSVFVLLMLLAALKILLSNGMNMDTKTNVSLFSLSFAGTFAGFFTGFVGVGGGFLIVPALVFLASLSLLQATATSLVIIFLQSMLGILAYFQYATELFVDIKITHVAVIISFGVIGSYFGMWCKHKLDQTKLLTSFAYFLLIVACSIFVERVFL